MSKHERLKQARERAGFATVTAAAQSLGVALATYSQHENGRRGFDVEQASHYARRFKVNPSWLLFGEGAPLDAAESGQLGDDADEMPEPNATIQPGEVRFNPNDKIPLYGQAVGGDDGEFILNGNRIDDVLAPPALRHVKGAFAVEVAGDSMEPRYFAGENVFVHPGRAVSRGSFVVAEILKDPESVPSAYVKQFVRMDSKHLVLRQFNPEKELVFDREKVVRVHRIVGLME